MKERDNEFRNEQDITDFVVSLPGSTPPEGKTIYLDENSSIDISGKRNLEMERAANSEDILLMFDKYNIPVRDRKRLILAILNLRQPE